MTTRREFTKKSLLATSGFVLASRNRIFASPASQFISNRPAKNERKFVSSAVDSTIQKVKAEIKNPELGWMFENCFPNTLDTTVKFKYIDGRPDTFIITGDIDAMWLRDSTAQVWPYLSLVNKDQKLKELIAGLVNRQTTCILTDPYANAFYDSPRTSEWQSDITAIKPGLHERKWEIDSLCYPVRLAFHFWKKTNDTSCFDNKWLDAARLIVKTFKEQQRKEEDGPYSFMRRTEKPTDSLPGNGFGNPINPVGLVVSSFRPSDDATIFPFLIPSNYFAVVSLKQMADICETIYIENAFAQECIQLADEIEAALQKYAVVEHMSFGKILAFEVDGFGNKLFMDDTNVPSLISLPYLGCLDQKDPLYQRTRQFIYSTANPYYWQGKYLKGLGSPHTGKDLIWPMSLTLQALTSNDENEIRSCLKMILKSHAGTGFIHESVNKDNPKIFTRSWFAWANTLFGELILDLYHQKKDILTNDI